MQYLEKRHRDLDKGSAEVFKAEGSSKRPMGVLNPDNSVQSWLLEALSRDPGLMSEFEGCTWPHREGSWEGRNVTD